LLLSEELKVINDLKTNKTVINDLNTNKTVIIDLKPNKTVIRRQQVADFAL